MLDRKEQERRVSARLATKEESVVCSYSIIVLQFSLTLIVLFYMLSLIYNI